MSIRDGRAEWRYTSVASEYVNGPGRQPSFEELFRPNVSGKYQGRRQIHRDSRINGGVYLTVSPIENVPISEACVVDDKKQPILLECYRELRMRAERAQKQDGLPLNHVILDEVFQYVGEVLPYNLDFVNDFARACESGTKVALEIYINNQAGVCRHQSLLVGYLLEKLVGDKVLRGKVSVERNFIPGEGGHSWVRYTSSAGDVYILDPAQHFIGTLEEAKRRAFWDYRRPEEVERDGSGQKRGILGKIRGLTHRG